MRTILHVAATYPSSSNRLDLQSNYAHDSYRLELLHLTATSSEAIAQGRSSIPVTYLPQWPHMKTGDVIAWRKVKSAVRRLINRIWLIKALITSA